MRSGICPKCESPNIYVKKNGVYAVKHYDLYLDWGESSSYDSYVCTRCGYFENYLTNISILKKISEKWDKIE